MYLVTRNPVEGHSRSVECHAVRVTFPRTAPACHAVGRCAGSIGGSLATKTTRTTKKSTGYDAGNIQILEGLEPVRKRPGMYIGTTSSRGLHHLVYEVVDNAIDEAMAGFCRQDPRDDPRRRLGVSVVDNGRGIPVKPIPGAKDRRPAVEVVLTVLHAGGKFGGGGYAHLGRPARRGRLGRERPLREALGRGRRVTASRGHSRTSAASRSASSRRARRRPRRARACSSGPTPRSSSRRSSSSARSSLSGSASSRS